MHTHLAPSKKLIVPDPPTENLRVDRVRWEKNRTELAPLGALFLLSGHLLPSFRHVGARLGSQRGVIEQLTCCSRHLCRLCWDRRRSRGNRRLPFTAFHQNLPECELLFRYGTQKSGPPLLIRLRGIQEQGTYGQREICFRSFELCRACALGVAQARQVMELR